MLFYTVNQIQCNVMFKANPMMMSMLIFLEYLVNISTVIFKCVKDNFYFKNFAKFSIFQCANSFACFRPILSISVMFIG